MPLSPARPAVRSMGHPQMPARWLGTKLPLRVVIQTRNLHSRSTFLDKTQDFFNVFHWWRTPPVTRAMAGTAGGCAVPCIANSYGPRGEKRTWKTVPTPGRAGTAPVRHGKEQQSWFIILFLCITVSINNADLRVRSFLAAVGALRDPCPCAAGKRRLRSGRRAKSGSSPGLMPAGGFTAGGNPPETSALWPQRETMSSRRDRHSAAAAVGAVGNVHRRRWQQGGDGVCSPLSCGHEVGGPEPLRPGRGPAPSTPHTSQPLLDPAPVSPRSETRLHHCVPQLHSWLQTTVARPGCRPGSHPRSGKPQFLHSALLQVSFFTPFPPPTNI